eukprot:c12637_g1_i1 orf=77-1465(+)
MGERLLLLGKDLAVGALTADVGKLVDSVLDVALSVKHCKSKCLALAEKVRLVHSSVQVVEEQRRKCSHPDRPRFSEAEYGEALIKFIQVIQDCKDVLRRYQNRSAFIRVFSSYRLEDEFEALDARLEMYRKYFSMGLLLRLTTASYDQQDEMQDMRDTMSLTLQKIQSLQEERVQNIPEESLMLQGIITLQDQADLYGGYMLQGRLQRNGEEDADVILIASTQEKKEAAIARLLTDCSPLLRFLGRYDKDGILYAVVERPASEIVTLDEVLSGLEGLPVPYRVLRSDWRLKRMIAYEIALGVSHAHNAGVLHRNLRSSNIFLTDECQPKLFGFLQGRIKAEKSDKRFNNSEQVRWAAPEMLQRGRPEFNEKCDIFSLGVIMWELITNEYPFADTKTSIKVISERTKNHESLHFPAAASYNEELLKFVQISMDCMDKLPGNRPDLNHILHQLAVLAPENMSFT